ncbi:hypothetical protein B0I37DRAFT_167460 [Chaetomium sp. MPI-CAGE-AT-0009]|nr:hypothetical protein B0I37DRAFT_167460 [Chaetomium sp. MPI-CAGE-AT-0009]
MDNNPGPGAIARNVHIALRAFQSLIESIHDADNPGNPHQRFEDESTRFKMWVGNLGAHQCGRASLDYRLREAPHLQEQVIYLLKDLSESLVDALQLADTAAQCSGFDDAKSLPAQDKLEQSIEDGFTDSDDEEASPQSDLATLGDDVKEAIDCLLRLSVAIANPAPHERLRVGSAGPFEDVSFRETYDIGYVQDKFPKMDPALARVLGKGITRRRQFFKYREAHHAKLAAGLGRLAHDGNAEGTGQTEIVPNTVASSLPDHLKALGTIVLDEDKRSETGMSRTSYATSAGFVPGEVDGQALEPSPPPKVPSLPEAAKRGSFECPFCYRMVSASTRAAWKRHVFGDLRPYTCLFTDCVESNGDFDRRHLWEAHISQHHWQSWSCAFNCDRSFPSASDLRQHLSHQHMPSTTDEQLNAVLSLGRRPTAVDTASRCPVCGHTVLGLKLYIRHVGRHLEHLALFALPSLEDENPSLEDENHSEEGGSDMMSDVPLADKEHNVFMHDFFSFNRTGSEGRSSNRSQTSSHNIQGGGLEQKTEPSLDWVSRDVSNDKMVVADTAEPIKEYGERRNWVWSPEDEDYVVIREAKSSLQSPS